MKQIIKFCVISLLLIIYEGTIFGQTFKKVTNISELQDGDVIAIVNEANNQALSTTQNEKNRKATPITIKDGCFTSTTSVQEITLESYNKNWYLKVGTDDYLYANGVKDGKGEKGAILKTGKNKNTYSRVSITFSGGNVFIQFLGDNSYNQIAYNNQHELFSAYQTSSQSTVQIYKKQSGGLMASSLSFGSTNDNHTFFKNAGDKFTLLATLTPTIKGATIQYTSSSLSVASVNEKTGEVTALREGDSEIKASFAGNNTYHPSSASYTIHVNKEGFFDFTQTANDYGSGCTPSNIYYITNKTIWTAGKVTLTTDKAEGEGFRWLKNTDGIYDFRAYSYSVFTISVAEGYYITSITMKGAIPSSSLRANDENIENGKWSGMSQSVVFKPSNTLEIKSITVNYTQQQESLTTAASGFATYVANYPVDYSKLGLTVYEVAVNQEQTKVIYTPFTGAVPAGMAVLVQGVPNKEYSLTPATVADHSYKTDLRASDGTVKAADSEIYAFATLRGISGFKLVTDGVVIPAKKGYLKLTSAGSAKNFFAFDDVDTGIGHIDANNMGTTSVVYNLAGQRVDKYYKGIVIENGKKIIRK